MSFSGRGCDEEMPGRGVLLQSLPPRRLLRHDELQVAADADGVARPFFLHLRQPLLLLTRVGGHVEAESGVCQQRCNNVPHVVAHREK